MKFFRSELIDVNTYSVSFKNGDIMTADKIVIATGAWSNSLARKLKFNSKIESERGYHVFFKGANMSPPFPLMISDGKFIATPMEGGLRCAGVVEFGGLKAGPSIAPIHLIRRRIRDVYPTLGFEGAKAWMGPRRATPAGLPLLGSGGGYADVICAFGAEAVSSAHRRATATASYT